MGRKGDFFGQTGVLYLFFQPYIGMWHNFVLVLLVHPCHNMRGDNLIEEHKIIKYETNKLHLQVRRHAACFPCVGKHIGICFKQLLFEGQCKGCGRR